jgi:hypothetical protein
MADIDIKRIAKIVSGEMDDPTLVKKDETGEQEIDIDGGSNAEEPTEKGGPSFMPDLASTDNTPPETHQNSDVDTATAISVVAALKQELGKIGCTLKDYQIKPNLNGFDLENIRVGTENIDELRKMVPNMDGENRHKIANKVASLALRAISDGMAMRMKDEFGFDMKAFEYDGADVGSIAFNVQAPEDPAADAAGAIENMDMGLPPEGEEDFGDIEMEMPGGEEPMPPPGAEEEIPPPAPEPGLGAPPPPGGGEMPL